ncbi:MAG: 50S ribosomal protein L6 [Alphaproteobacteria bacterium]|nr:50S ribosomal protein L6 [Alphaproteobacteria bacterium]MBE8220889.1 50S ribosomal protein L6 [Alphaproteobacteria bacterium]
MSRTGKKPVSIPKGVELRLDGQNVSVKGSKGELTARLSELVNIAHTDDAITLTPTEKSQEASRFWGLSRSLLANLVEGVSEGFTKKLELRGVGYRAQLQGKTLKLALGYSNDINFSIPEGIKVDCPSQTEITITGIEKQKVGQVAAEIRNLRPPEPYKGKGVRYEGEYVLQKEGKKK